MQSLGLWLPPVGFDECNGDIFKVGKVGRAVEGFLPSADSAYESYVKKQLGVQDAGTFSTNLLPDKPLASKQEGCWNPRSGRQRIVEDVGKGLPVKTALEEKLWKDYMARQEEHKRRAR